MSKKTYQRGLCLTIGHCKIAKWTLFLCGYCENQKSRLDNRKNIKMRIEYALLQLDEVEYFVLFILPNKNYITRISLYLQALFQTFYFNHIFYTFVLRK